MPRKNLYLGRWKCGLRQIGRIRPRSEAIPALACRYAKPVISLCWFPNYAHNRVSIALKWPSCPIKRYRRRDVNHHVRRGNRHAGENSAVPLFIRAQTRPCNAVSNLAAAQTADAGAAGAVPARGGQFDTGEACRREQGHVIGGIEAPLVRRDRDGISAAHDFIHRERKSDILSGNDAGCVTLATAGCFQTLRLSLPGHRFARCAIFSCVKKSLSRAPNNLHNHKPYKRKGK